MGCGSWRLALLAVAASFATFLPSVGTAYGSHRVPGSATSVAVSLVNNYRQTISSTQCAEGGGVPGTHRSPIAYPSCNPPAFLAGTAAALGPNSLDSNVGLTTMTGDIGIVVDLKGVICLGFATGCSGAGAPYQTPPEPQTTPGDVAARFRIRISDHANCFAPPSCPGLPPDTTGYNQPGTMTDLDFRFGIYCDTTGSCQAATSGNAIVPRAFASGEVNNMQVFRVRITDSGQNGVLGDVDDQEFAMQGLLLP